MKNLRYVFTALLATLLFSGVAEAAKKNVKGVQKYPNDIGAHYYTRTVALVSTTDTLFLKADTTSSTPTVAYFTTSSLRSGYNLSQRSSADANPDSISLVIQGSANQADSAVFTGWLSYSYDNGTTFSAAPQATCVFPGTAVVSCILKAPYVPDALMYWRGYVSSATDSLYFTNARDFTTRK